MLTAEEGAERRALQHTLYAAGGSLTAQQRDRLAELNSRHLGASSEARHERPEAGTDGGADATESADFAESARRLFQEIVVEPEVESATTPGNPKGRLRRLTEALRTQQWWRRPRVIVTGLLALVLLGFWVGSSIPGRVNVALPMSAEQAERRGQLLQELEDYDRESFILVAEAGEGTLWYGTRMGGDLLCAVIDVDGVVSPTCVRPETADFEGIFAQLSTSDISPADRYFAMINMTRDGVPLVRFDFQPDSMFHSGPRLSEEEQVVMQSLVTDGYDGGSVEVLGYLDDSPIWLAYNEDWIQPCIIVDHPVEGRLAACTPEDTPMAASPELEFTLLQLFVPETPGAEAALIEYAIKEYGQRYVTITRSPELPETAWGPRIS